MNGIGKAEWGMGNAEWGMRNAEWGMGNKKNLTILIYNHENL